MSDATKRQRTDMPAWSPSSWRARESLQMATYDDKAAYETVVAKLSKLPPLVQPAECDRLIELLAAAGRGERFVVQGGDCAERFVDCEPERIAASKAPSTIGSRNQQVRKQILGTSAVGSAHGYHGPVMDLAAGARVDGPIRHPDLR